MSFLKVELKTDPKVIRESLQRIGVGSKHTKVLYPSCYLIENDNGEYFIAHFKQLFMDRPDWYNNITEDDFNRRNAIAWCLKKWQLIDVDDVELEPHDKFVFIIPHSEKSEWTIKHKVKHFY